MSKRNKEPQDRYVQLHHYMLKSDAWKALSAPARAVYIQIGSRYNGANNGKLAFSVRDAASECALAKDTAARAFKELVDRGFIDAMRHGCLSKKTRIASEWRLTAFKCDLTGTLKTCAFLRRGGPEFSSYTPLKRGPSMDTPRRPPVPINSLACPKQLHSLSQLTPIEEPECPKQLPSQADFEPSPVPNNCTHIIYQSPRTDKRHLFPPPISRIVTAPTALDTIPWMPPRRFTGQIRPQPMEMRQAVDADALTDLQRLFFSNALPDCAARPSAVR